MRKNLSNLVQLFTRIRGMILGFLPTRLPHGLSDFEAFFQKLAHTYALPDNPSYKHAVATMVMNLGPTTAYKAPYFFALSIKKAMANQTAFQVIQDLRDAEKNAAKEAQEKQTGEAMPTPGVAAGDGS